jgi:hypothetical protein
MKGILMNPNELKRVIDKYFGLTGNLELHGKTADIRYLTATGFSLVDVWLYQINGTWQLHSVDLRSPSTDLRHVLPDATASA